MTRLQEKYRDEVIPALRDRLQVSNDLAVPRLEKIVISMGVGEAIVDSKRLDEAVGHLTTLSGQKPQITSGQTDEQGRELLRELGMPFQKEDED
jgi:large subunit ribosomal protein L5